MLVIFKYVLLVLPFGTYCGEGGQVALYCKISKILKTDLAAVKLSGGKGDGNLLQLTRSETTDSISNIWLQNFHRRLHA